MLKFIWNKATAPLQSNLGVGVCPYKMKWVDIKTKGATKWLFCNLCNDNVIEDEIHFLLRCDFYPDIRRPSSAKAQLCNRDFHLNDKFIFIVNFVNMQFILASTLL